MMVIMTEAVTLHTISQSSTNPNSKKKREKRKRRGLSCSVLVYFGGIPYMQKFGYTARHKHSWPSTKAYTYTYTRPQLEHTSSLCAVFLTPFSLSFSL